MIRQYFNLTNKCNVECPFCCMWSGKSKHTFLSFDNFKEIIDSKTDQFELQLEGGEPFLHPSLYLFMEYAYSTNRCVKIVISTNGILLNDHLERLITFHNTSKIPFLLKPSINYYLYNLDHQLFKKCKDLYASIEFIEGFDIKFNVRIGKEAGWLIEKLKDNNLFEHSNVFEFQAYGRFENRTDYKKPFICQNIDDWFIYASDGTCFNKELIVRSQYEKYLL